MIEALVHCRMRGKTESQYDIKNVNEPVLDDGKVR